jgi:adenylate kinase family enzyme
MQMQRIFVLISGLSGSGKTTLARRLAPALHLPLIDKDDILERLFESKRIADGLGGHPKPAIDRQLKTGHHA